MALRRSRGRAGRWALGAIAAALTLGAAANPAAANNPKGRHLGTVPVTGSTAARTLRALHADVTSPLLYNGGPVMHSNTAVAIYWDPAGGASFPADYRSGVDQYFAGVAAQSGATSNVYSVTTQYLDSSGHSAAYASSFGGDYLDSQPYPTTSNCPATTGRPVCLTDAQINHEVSRFIAAHGLPGDSSHIYFVFTPPGVSSCFDTTSSLCAYSYFCAYHSFDSSGGPPMYADMPYITGVGGCDSGEHPNGGTADGVLGATSHEHIETITDPLGSAWFDATGDEIGDKCVSYFGSTLGGSSGTLFDQLIGGHGYWLQDEWSNAASTGAASSGCVARSSSGGQLPTVALSATPSSALVGQPILFDGSASSDAQTITGFAWDFGDGTGSSSGQVYHAYRSPGVYTVRLRVTDGVGLSATAAQTVSVTTPASAPSVASPGADASDVPAIEAPADSGSGGGSAGSGARPAGSGAAAATCPKRGATRRRCQARHGYKRALAHCARLSRNKRASCRRKAKRAYQAKLTAIRCATARTSAARRGCPRAKGTTHGRHVTVLSH
jgi:hypothetical protein